MMMDFEDLVPGISVHAVECPEPTIISCIRTAVSQMCEDCRLWRAVDTFGVAGGTPGPELIVNTGAGFIFEIESVCLDGRPLTALPLDEVIRQRGNALSDDGYPRSYTQASPNTLLLYPKGDADFRGNLTVSCFKKPKPTDDEAPAYILNQYRTAINHGALSAIFAIPRQPWSDPQLAAYYANSFQASINSKSMDFAIGQQRGLLRTGRDVRGKYF